MTPDNDFQDLIRRVRRGDPDAARTLVEQYESMIRRVIRIRLRDSRLRAAFDSMDICQSVLGSFFIRAANGEYELDQSDELPQLLIGIARNKLATQARRQAADKRDYRRVQAGTVDLNAVTDGGASPSRFAAAKDLLDAVRQRLTPEERQLADLRQQGCEWAEIAKKFGDTPVNLRKRFSRAMDRVSLELGLDEPDA